MNKSQNTHLLKEIIYFDEAKAWSLISQLQGGMQIQLKKVSALQGGISSELGFNLLGVSASLGSQADGTQESEITFNPFHEVLNNLEKLISVHLSKFDSRKLAQELYVPARRYRLRRHPLVKLHGKVAFEDLGNIGKLARDHVVFSEAINYMIKSSNPTIQLIKNEIENQASIIAGMSEGKQKREAKQKLNEVVAFLDQLKMVSTLDSEFVENLEKISETMMKGRIKLRVYPDSSDQDLQFLANLNPQHFSQCTFEETIHNYGYQPDVQMVVIGIVTSVPEPPRLEETSHQGNETGETGGAHASQEGLVGENSLAVPLEKLQLELQERERLLALDDPDSVKNEKISALDGALQAMFPALQDLKEFFRGGVFPRIVIAPIAIYREIS